jgi:hypothetical protein
MTKMPAPMQKFISSLRVVMVIPRRLNCLKLVQFHFSKEGMTEFLHIIRFGVVWTGHRVPCHAILYHAICHAFCQIRMSIDPLDWRKHFIWRFESKWYVAILLAFSSEKIRHCLSELMHSVYMLVKLVTSVPFEYVRIIPKRIPAGTCLL